MNRAYAHQQIAKIRASRALMERFCEHYAELVSRLPDGVRSEEDAAIWAEFYLTAIVGPESEGAWDETVISDAGLEWSLRKHVAFFVFYGMGPKPSLDARFIKPNREQVMWCLWDLAEPESLNSRAWPWQAAVWAEEILPTIRHDMERIPAKRSSEDEIAHIIRWAREDERKETESGRD